MSIRIYNLRIAFVGAYLALSYTLTLHLVLIGYGESRNRPRAASQANPHKGDPQMILGKRVVSLSSL